MGNKCKMLHHSNFCGHLWKLHVYQLNLTWVDSSFWNNSWPDLPTATTNYLFLWRPPSRSVHNIAESSGWTYDLSRKQLDKHSWQHHTNLNEWVSKSDTTKEIQVLFTHVGYGKHIPKQKTSMLQWEG